MLIRTLAASVPLISCKYGTTAKKEQEEPLFEESNPNLENINGGLKTSNPDGQRWQRRYVHVADKESKFRKKVETVLVVHGWKTPAKTEPMTLIILSVKLNCHARDFRFQSVRMWFTFDEDRDAVTPHPEEAAPEVVAYAPFVDSQAWNPSKEAIGKTTTTSVMIGGEKYVKAEVERANETNRSYTRTHFDRGSADTLVKKDKAYGVAWYCEQNKLENYGVKPEFHIAVLIKRQHTKADGNSIPFSGVFDMRVEAGTIHDFNENRRRFFRMGRPEDEAVYYDPNREIQANAAGEGLKAIVKEDNLGELIGGPTNQWLRTLVDSTGSLSGIEPMQPKTA